MNEPPASVEHEPPEQIDPAFAQLYDRIEELEAELAQHQWHRCEDELPSRPGRDIEVYVDDESERHYGTGKSEDIECPPNPGWTWTHWRYSTPPETSE